MPTPIIAEKSHKEDAPDGYFHRHFVYARCFLLCRLLYFPDESIDFFGRSVTILR